MASETHIPEGTKVLDLPNGVVIGAAVTSTRATGSEGEEHALVVISFEFQAGPGTVGRQSFIMEKDMAQLIRKNLKNPTPLNPSEEDTPS
jgi:hypothetical protein